MHKTIKPKNPVYLLLLSFLLIASQALGQQQDEFLQPQEAFKVTAQADGPGHILLNWSIADGYYLYRSKFKFASESDGIDLGAAELPAGKVKNDEFFGEMEIYRDQVEIRLPVTRGSDADNLALKTISQGCADAGLCYPPQTQRVSIQLAAAEPKASSALTALSGLGNDLGLDEEPEILAPEEAFKFEARVESGDQLRLLWQIAEGTYLYQDKIQLALLDGNGVALGDYQLPPAEIKEGAIRPDGTIGDLPVYHNLIDLPLPLKRSNTDATEIKLEVRYQGCAELGICYPPIKGSYTLALPAIAQASASAEETSAANDVVETTAQSTQPVAEQDQIAATLAGGSTWLIILSFFGFGLLLSLTPCVFPMIPILSGIIAGQGPNITTTRAFTFSLVYVLAMAVTYTIAGILAGLFGQNLQAAFQNPWILSGFALVFVLLAFSMFGFYELQLPSKWQSKLADASNKQQGGSLTGVAVMGLLSALIVGPCVAPPLAGALIFIGQTGDWQLGGLALFMMALGMGVPLIALGTSAGKLLPRAGKWMDAVKAVFGVGMLAVAIILLERIIPPAVAMLLWGMLLIISAIYMGALRELAIEASGWSKLWKGVGLVIMIYGTLMLVGVAAGGKDTVQPLRGIAAFSGGGAGDAQHISFKRIKTVDDLQREVAEASSAGKPVMLDFYADWCVSCKQMERYTFSDPAVIAGLKDFVLLQADVTADDEADRALLQGHFGLPGPPSIMFYGRDGQERKNYRVVGFMPADQFAAHISKAVQ
ncbi:MAG: thiol:disulfide interchange protein [Sedimenticola sp.]|nr:MAG: thiol:disulfide interchange protein [Sedimenticola sp.]